jgi:hypothetical protein
VLRLSILPTLVFSILMAMSLPAAAALRLTPNLVSLRVIEWSGSPTSFTFGANSAAALSPRANPLGGGNRDFNGLSDEHYDLFYSDAAGVADQNGDYLTIEAQFLRATGGGHNIDEAYLVFADGTEQCACAVTSAVYMGANPVAGSAANAADCTLGTVSVMGSTTLSTDRLRITLQFDCPTPAAKATWGSFKALYR